MSPFRVGILSDTHGSLPASAVEALDGVDHIVHAGDIGGQRVLLELEALAPVTAVEGNMDARGAIPGLRDREAPLIGGVRFVVVHDLGAVRTATNPKDTAIVVSGHTHSANIEWLDGVLYVNPGSVSRPRGGGPSVAIIRIDARSIDARIIPLVPSRS